MTQLRDAIQVATELHDGQLDKQGAPYILHPLRVMLAMPSNQLRVVAVLHDVIEDGGVTLEHLTWIVRLDIVQAKALDALTRRAGETYARYVERVAANDVARVVKIADLRDNLDASRGPLHAPARYLWALTRLDARR